MENQSYYGKLKVIELRRGAKNVHPTALCECECGNLRTVRTTKLRRALVVSCVSCARMEGAKRGADKRRVLTPDTAAFHRAIDQYRSNAQKRGIAFALSKKDCLRVLTSSCFYCGAIPSSEIKTKDGKGLFTYSGIDRRDNELGYTVMNSVPCCKTCNFAKREMSEKEFLGWVKRVYDHQVNK